MRLSYRRIFWVPPGDNLSSLSWLVSRSVLSDSADVRWSSALLLGFLSPRFHYLQHCSFTNSTKTQSSEENGDTRVQKRFFNHWTRSQTAEKISRSWGYQTSVGSMCIIFKMADVRWHGYTRTHYTLTSVLFALCYAMREIDHVLTKPVWSISGFSSSIPCRLVPDAPWVRGQYLTATSQRWRLADMWNNEFQWQRLSNAESSNRCNFQVSWSHHCGSK